MKRLLAASMLFAAPLSAEVDFSLAQPQNVPMNGFNQGLQDGFNMALASRQVRLQEQYLELDQQTMAQQQEPSHFDESPETENERTCRHLLRDKEFRTMLREQRAVGRFIESCFGEE